MESSAPAPPPYLQVWMLFLVIYTFEMLTTRFLQSGFEWVMLNVEYSQVTKSLLSLIKICSLCSHVKDQTKTRYVHYIVDQREYCGFMEQIKNIWLKNLMKCACDLLWKLMDNNAVSTRNWQLFDIHIKFTLIIKHSLKNRTLTFNICHSPVEQSLSAHLHVLSKLCMIWEHRLMSQISCIQIHWFTLRNKDSRLPAWRTRSLFEHSSAWAKVSAQDHKNQNFIRLL